MGVESFFRPFEPRPEERKKVNFWKQPQRRPYAITTSLRVKTAIPCVLFLDFESRG